MVPALLLLTGLTAWVPARWNTGDAASLELVRGTPVNCLLLQRRNWSAEFSEKAAGMGVAVLGLSRTDEDPSSLAQQALAAKLSGLVLEGPPQSRLRAVLADSRLAVVELAPRVQMDLEGGAAVIGTHQGVWPGINEATDDTAKAAPSGAPWIDTNGGFLRFVRAATPSLVWMGQTPPANKTYPAARYLQAVSDAAIVGARWIVALDEAFEKRLYSGDAAAREQWLSIARHLAHFEQHPEWRQYRPYSQMAMVQDIASGGLYSGSILDMISVKHTPVSPVPARQLNDERMKDAKVAVNVDPGSLTEEQRETLRRFTRAGGMLLTAAQSWKFPVQRPDQMTLDNDSVEQLDRIYKEINTLTYRRNTGVRLYNVASMLSNLLVSPDGRQVVLHLANFSDYPVENITAHVAGKWKKARLLEPGRGPRELAVYDHEEGTGVELEKVASVATVILE